MLPADERPPVATGARADAQNFFARALLVLVAAAAHAFSQPSCIDYSTYAFHLDAHPPILSNTPCDGA